MKVCNFRKSTYLSSIRTDLEYYWVYFIVMHPGYLIDPLKFRGQALSVSVGSSKMFETQH